LEDNHCFAEFGFQVSSNSIIRSLHKLCTGAYTAIKLLRMKPLVKVKSEDRWWRIFPMSFVFSINIVLENMSLLYIPVSFLQTIKSFPPATTVILQWLLWRRVLDQCIWASLVSIVGGMLLTAITKLSFQYIWILCCLVRLPCHIHKDNSSSMNPFFMDIGLTA
ncbi:unnamed protein product, partial [Musa textilis]